MSENEEHGRHLGTPAKWHALSPSFPSGTMYHCVVPVGTRPDGFVDICNLTYTKPSLRCPCPVGRSRIVRGRCALCGLIVSGHEDDADSDPDNWP